MEQDKAQLLSAAIGKRYTLVFFCLLCRHFSCCLQAGNDSDTTWHFPGCQRAVLNERHWFPLVLLEHQVAFTVRNR